MDGIEATVAPDMALFNIVRRDSLVMGNPPKCTGERRIVASTVLDISIETLSCIPILDLAA
jgi:hypothetical protein